MKMMLEVMIWVLDMEVDKVADEVTNMDVDKVTNMMAKITWWSNLKLIKWGHLMDEFPTNTSGATWWSNLELIKVGPPDEQIFN